MIFLICFSPSATAGRRQFSICEWMASILRLLLRYGRILPQMVFLVKTLESRSFNEIVAPLNNEEAVNVIYGTAGE